MNIRYVAICCLMMTGVIGCRSTDLVQGVPDVEVRKQRVQDFNRKAQLEVANAGCSIGLSSGLGTSRVMMLDRNRLPFNFPIAKLPPANVSAWRMQVVRLPIPLSSPQSSAILACLVPMNGTAFDSLRKSFAKTKAEDWEKFASQVANEGSQRPSDLYHEVANVLLDSTLKSGRTKAPATILKTNPAKTMADPQPLATVTVTAYANVVVYSISSLMRLFGGPEVPILTWEMEVAQQAWSHDCDEWNNQMDEWEATKDAVAAEANSIADDLEAMANAMQSGLAPLQTANASCKPTNGKKMCIDFFIMDCHIWILGVGDCRDFDKDAEYESSRVQLYLDPSSNSWEVKYNCSLAFIPTASYPNYTTQSFCDSSAVFDPARDVTPGPPDAQGWRTWTMSFKSPACIRRGNVACPAINASITYRPNASAPGGYDLSWERDGFPAMGVYTRNAADTGWDVVKEDHDKVLGGVQAIRALAGEIRAKGYNYPPPGSQPPGCYRQ